MFLDESGTKKTWIAIVQDRCFAETRDENAILCQGDGTTGGLFHGQNGIDLGMFHITFYHIWRRVAGIDVHGNNILSIIYDTQMTMMVLVHATFMDLAQVQNIHHTEINRCKNNVFRPVVLRKQYLDFLTKGFKVMFDLVILKDYLLLFIIHSSLKDQRFHFKFIFFFQFKMKARQN